MSSFLNPPLDTSKWKVTFQADSKRVKPHEIPVYAPTIYEALAKASALPYSNRIIAIELQDS